MERIILLVIVYFIVCATSMHHTEKTYKTNGIPTDNFMMRIAIFIFNPLIAIFVIVYDAVIWLLKGK